MMSRILSLLAVILLLGTPRANAQTVCNPSGNMIVYSNYDGGTLNINVDANVPNLIIGVVSYEAVAINISGTFASNVTAVRYAGYNALNSNHCTPNIANTTITGAPTTATTSIVLMPTSPVTNANGYSSIICGYTCNTTSSQGGCNTADQITGYFQQQFPTASIRYHKTQYGCWSGTQSVSSAGNCCAGVSTPPVSTLAINATATSINCFGGCNATATAVATGGVTPYSFQWTGGPATASWSNRCAGTYYVSVTDGANTVRLDTVVISQPAAITTTINQTACSAYAFNGANLTTAGQYKDTLVSANGCDSIVILNLTLTPVNINVSPAGAVLTAAAPPPATYQWLRCTGTTTISYTVLAGATSQVYTATQNGQYAVRITQSGCSDTSTCRPVTGLASVENAVQKDLLNVYPNPISADYFTIEVPKALAGSAFTLTDAAGRSVKEGVLHSVKTDVRVTGLAPGMYLLRIAGVERALQLVR